ncbi:MAG: hypothetical protein ACI9YB_003329 [Halioglobus sp.]|jgi:hypothetical protein
MSYRGAAKALSVFFSFFPGLGKAPSYQSIRNWVMKFGFYKMVAPKQIAKDWALLLDHTIQIGTTKVLIVLGLRLSQLPVGRPLNFQDVEPIRILPMKTSNQDVIFQVLEEIREDLGEIRLLSADEGSDLKAGCNGFVETYPTTIYVSDIVHKLANLLQAELKNDPAWNDLMTKAALSRTKYQQTTVGYATPPNQRSKARYMNAEILVAWAMKVIAALESGRLDSEEQGRIFEAFGWVYGLKKSVREFHELCELISLTNHVIRCHGIHSETKKHLSQILKSISRGDKAKKFCGKILTFVSLQSAKAMPGERLLGSSELIESVIGCEKYHAGAQSKSGFTQSILIIGALTGSIDEELVAEAMLETRFKDIQIWSNNALGSTVQKSRKEFYAMGSVSKKKLEHKMECIIRKETLCA